MRQTIQEAAHKYVSRLAETLTRQQKETEKTTHNLLSNLKRDLEDFGSKTMRDQANKRYQDGSYEQRIMKLERLMEKEEEHTENKQSMKSQIRQAQRKDYNDRKLKELERIVTEQQKRKQTSNNKIRQYKQNQGR